MEFHKVTQILDALKHAPGRTSVLGASPTAASYLVARASQQFGQPLLVICPSHELAENIHSDLLAFAPAQHDCVLLPPWETSPYMSVAPSLRVRAMRCGALGSVLRANAHGSPLILVSSLQALIQNTLSPDLARSLSTELRVGSSLSREKLLTDLSSLGYLRVDPVEDAGTFALRGDILDLYVPGYSNPFRIEFFGDELERIRFFDPETQSTHKDETATVTQLLVTPAREFLINDSTAIPLLQNIKSHADSVGIQRADRDPVIENIRAGVYPEWSDAWSFFLDGRSHHFIEHIPDHTQIIAYDPDECKRAVTQHLEEEQARFVSAKNSRSFSVSPETIYFNPSQLLEQIHKNLFFEFQPFEHPDHLSTLRLRIENAPLLSDGGKPSSEKIHLYLLELLAKNYQIHLYVSSPSKADRLRFFLNSWSLQSRSEIQIFPFPLSEGFVWPSEHLVALSEKELFGASGTSQRDSNKTPKSWAGLQDLSLLYPNDLVVHRIHGIGRYLGLTRLNTLGAPCDFIALEYANKDKLYLPVYRLDQVQKYHAPSEDAALDRLGGSSFEKTKTKVRETVKTLAVDLIRLYAERSLKRGFRFTDATHDPAFQEFEVSFPHEETPDQAVAIDEVLKDMHSGNIMDRLVCGDVGFGKTEVAIRAAYRAVLDGKQVAVLVPTTVLAYQHELSFKKRFENLPVHVESLSRFKSAKQQKAVLEQLKEGRVDILIGTHRLLSKDVSFKELGLIIVDEEHRFGVEHKEKLKALKINTAVLTLTATPIPRTLQLCLSGIREISIIKTPPADRLPIRTYVAKFDDDLIKRAIDFELGRGGQVFFVHNRVQTIYEIANHIKTLCPNAKYGIAHGQMDERKLEEVMLQFYDQKINVLVCSAIIESGIDLPTTNTIIVNRADLFGLAQLYQIRGRVGRGENRAYAYLLVPPDVVISPDAKKRLEVIQRFVELGSGFSIANHDLEIRGGGNLLGPQQSGHIAAVGLDLYTELLEEAIHTLRGEGSSPVDQEVEPEIKVPYPAFLPETYVPDVHQRLTFYRRLSSSSSEQSLEQSESEMRDRYGPLPLEASNLVWIIRIKQLLRRFGVESLTLGADRFSLLFGKSTPLDPVKTVTKAAAYPDRYQLLPDSRLVASHNCQSLDQFFFLLEKFLEDLK